MSTLTTKALGNVEIEPAALVDFPDGLIGFGEYHRFALIRDKDESPFLWLQSAEEASLAFVVIDPSIFMNDSYKPAVAPSDLDNLGTSRVEDCDIYSIVTIPQAEPQSMTANLQGPILINREKRVGRQVISMDDRHVVRMSILENLGG